MLGAVVCFGPVTCYGVISRCECLKGDVETCLGMVPFCQRGLGQGACVGVN